MAVGKREEEKVKQKGEKYLEEMSTYRVQVYKSTNSDGVI